MGPVVGCWPPGAPGTREPAGRAREGVDVKSRDAFLSLIPLPVPVPVSLVFSYSSSFG